MRRCSPRLALLNDTVAPLTRCTRAAGTTATAASTSSTATPAAATTTTTTVAATVTTVPTTPSKRTRRSRSPSQHAPSSSARRRGDGSGSGRGSGRGGGGSRRGTDAVVERGAASAESSGSSVARLSARSDRGKSAAKRRLLPSTVAAPTDAARATCERSTGTAIAVDAVGTAAAAPECALRVRKKRLPASSNEQLRFNNVLAAVESVCLTSPTLSKQWHTELAKIGLPLHYAKYALVRAAGAYVLSEIPREYRSGSAARSVCASCGNSTCLLSVCHHCLHPVTRPIGPSIDWRRVRARLSKIAASLAKLQEQKEQRAQKRSAEQMRDAEACEESDLNCSQVSSADLSQPSRSSSTDSCATPVSVAATATSSAGLDQFSAAAPSDVELAEWREAAVLRSLSWVRQFVQRSREDDFTSNGGDIIFLYRFLIDRCSGPVKLAAESTMTAMLAKWERNAASSVLDSYAECELLQNYVECLHAKLGLRQRYSERDLTRMQHRVSTELAHHGVEDICRFNPTVGDALPVSQAGYCQPCGQYQNIEDRLACPACGSSLSHPSDLDALCESLVWTSVYRDVGVHPMETSNATCYLDSSLRFIRQVRPYRALREMGADLFRFQCYLVTHLTFVLSTSSSAAGSSWYSHQLDRRLLLEEWLFLQANVDAVIQLDDPELVGEFVAALRLMGARDSDACMLKGYAYLLQSELTGNQAGGWVSSAASFYKRYHAAYCACIALADMTTDGEAKLSSELVQHFAHAAPPSKC